MRMLINFFAESLYDESEASLAILFAQSLYHEASLVSIFLALLNNFGLTLPNPFKYDDHISTKFVHHESEAKS